PENPRGCGRARVAVQAAELWTAADAPRIEQPLPVAVHGAAIHVEAKDPRPLDEERPPLLEERLERRKVEHAGVRLHLAEVGVDRSVHGEVRGDAVLEIGAGGGLLAAAEPGR